MSQDSLKENIPHDTRKCLFLTGDFITSQLKKKVLTQ